MKRSSLAIPLAGALGAAVAGHFYLERLEAEAAGGPKVALLIASEDIPLGARLTDKVLGVRDVPQAYVDSRQVRAGDSSKVVGARVSSALRANEAVLWSDVAASTGPTRVLSSLVEQGMRAVVIDSRAGEFGGLLRPGDRVDVLFTDGSKGERDTGATVTLLQNLMVLSVNGSIAKAGDVARQGFGNGGGVTLAASVEQAQILTQARERGRLSLTLRNPDDIGLVQGVAETTGKDLASLPVVARDPQAGPTRGGAP